jgi:NADPH:quinone reductase-like Zn-dependent oxidoreductase
MMKAVRFNRFGGPEVLEIVDLPDPHPGRGQVRIAVRAAGVNPSDWKQRKGLMDEELPQTLGYEAAGVVDELGAIGEPIESGRFSLPVAQTFPLAEIAKAHPVSEDGHVHGKLVLLLD